MAVSQYLRPGSLLDAVKSQLTPDVIRNASSFVKEPESATRQTLNAAVPSVLSGLAGMASSREKAGGLTNLIREGGFGAAAENVQSLFAGGAGTNSMISAGQQLLSRIFGGKLSEVNDLVAKSGGVSSSSSSKLLSLVAPLTLGILGKRAAAQGLDASGLASALLNERSDIAAAAPSGLAQLLGSGPTVVSRATEAGVRLAEPVHLERIRENQVGPGPSGAKPMRWLPLALLGLAILALLLFFRGRTARTNIASQATSAAKEALSRVELPGGTAINVPKGTINYNLAAFLADQSRTDVPKTFIFDHLNFESATTRLTPESVATVNDLASVLRAYPSAQAQLVGHTDNTGTPEANQTLSLNRANAVREMLIGQGVSADRIATTGYGQDRPIAPNDTETGRAQNRRLELNVTSK